MTDTSKPLIVIVDVEARGASPINGEMTEFGAVALNHDMTVIVDSFHGVLVETEPDPENPAVPTISDDATRYDLVEVMTRFNEWLTNLTDRPIFVSDNNGFDAMWITCAFDKANISNPFGHSSRRISDFYAGLCDDWRQTQKWKRYRVTKHTHNPVDDATGNAEALTEMIKQTRNK